MGREKVGITVPEKKAQGSVIMNKSLQSLWKGNGILKRETILI